MFKTRRGIDVEDKVPGDGGRGANWIHKNKIKPFQTLFKRAQEKVGGYNKARDYVGLSAHTLDDLEKGKISSRTGKKILEAYKKIQGEKG